MRIKRSTFCLLTVLGTLAGCSQTGGVRPGAAPEMRTVASVGDKPLPIVAGEPGGSLRAETEELDLPESSGARISGRVYDDRGKAVPNVRVRLAVSGSPGGKVIYATTDRSGAFTLRGVRAGSSHVVIAEYQGDEGIMTGRAQAKASQTDVRISLQARDGASSQGHASIRPARPRVEPISNIDPADDETSDGPRAAGKVNSEDLEPPPDDAVSLQPQRNLRLSRASDSSRSAARAGWNARQRPAAKAAAAAAGVADSSNDDSADSRPKSASESSSELDDDGPNPLPPALDTTATGPEPPSGLAEEKPIKVARNMAESSGRSRRASTSGGLGRDDTRAVGVMEAPGEREPRSMPEELLPGARVITPRSSAPISVTEDADSGSPSEAPPQRRRRDQSPSVGRGANRPGEADSNQPADGSAISGESSAAARPTWRELSHNQAEVPLDESILRAAHNRQPSDSGVVTLTGMTSEPKPARSRLLGGSRTPVDSSAAQTVCRFDPAERRLVDFQLPGLDGKMVSLHDIDADVILLDFWGSWCTPCKTSIPHLSDLQAKMGARRIQVVGIACEKGTSFQDRRASADAARKALGISYPILVSSKDGSCPVQQALQVQFYPTMVLLDRNGRLLAREQGATEVTLARMDRAIASSLK
jgi:thiol-disulfide isomerase/thioredoxin